MPDRWTITCGQPVRPAPAPGTSKLGGQPDWIQAPSWPIGETLGEPMTFLMQVALPESLRVGGHRMAYLFLAPHDPKRGNHPYLDDAGDNAVILQGGARFTPAVETRPLPLGPTLRAGKKSRFSRVVDDDPASPEVQVPVRLTRSSEPPPLSEVEQHELFVEDRPAWDAYGAAMRSSKVGGNPHWIQGPDTPLGGPWKLLAQLDREDVPCWAPFDGVLFAFVSADGSEGRLLYQIT